MSFQDARGPKEPPECLALCKSRKAAVREAFFEKKRLILCGHCPNRRSHPLPFIRATWGTFFKSHQPSLFSRVLILKKVSQTIWFGSDTPPLLGNARILSIFFLLKASLIVSTYMVEYDYRFLY